MISLRKLFSTKNISAVGLAAIGAAIILVIAGTAYFLQQKKQGRSIDEQISKTNTLIEEVRKISVENKKLSQTNANYSYCNAVLLARYTQTQRPIAIEDLNSCVFKVFGGNGGPTALQKEEFISLQAQKNKALQSNNTVHVTQQPNIGQKLQPAALAAPRTNTPPTIFKPAPANQLPPLIQTNPPTAPTSPTITNPLAPLLPSAPALPSTSCVELFRLLKSCTTL